MPIPFNTGYLPVQNGHEIYYAEYGNPKGQAILSLHGGPGSRSKSKHASLYNLDRYRVITFDQRGCGASLPKGETRFNTLVDLMGDIQRLQKILKVANWFVAGGSWGSTLALAYAQKYPKCIKGILLSSIFLARQRDLAWVFKGSEGAACIFPDLWEKHLQFLQKYQASPSNAAQVLLNELHNCSVDVAQDIAAGIQNWEGNLLSPGSVVQEMQPDHMSEEDIQSVKIFLHYEAHDFFLEPNELVSGLPVIEHIPMLIVHGRYDIVCPLEQAWEVQKYIQDVELIIVPSSGHKLTAEGEVAKRLAFQNFLGIHTAFRKDSNA